jgi:hypothetical protein
MEMSIVVSRDNYLLAWHMEWKGKEERYYLALCSGVSVFFVRIELPNWVKTFPNCYCLFPQNLQFRFFGVSSYSCDCTENKRDLPVSSLQVAITTVINSCMMRSPLNLKWIAPSERRPTRIYLKSKTADWSLFHRRDRCCPRGEPDGRIPNNFYLCIKEVHDRQLLV